MTKQLLLGTANPAKIAHIKVSLSTFPLTLLCPGDLRLQLEVREDGSTPESNARKKAHAYWSASRMPSLATDAGLRIARFPQEQQPGVWVKRIRGEEGVTDAEVFAHYQHELRRVGGQSEGCWQVALALQVTSEHCYCQVYDIPVMFTAEAQGQPMPGAPLNTLMVDPKSGKYYADMSYAERPDSPMFANFIRAHLDDLSA